MEIGTKLKNLRLRCGLTQEELAEKLGIQKSAVAKYESGRVENVKRSSIQKMSEIFRCDPAYLMGFRDNSSTYNSEHDRMTAYAESLLHRLDDSDLRNITRTMEGWLEDNKYKKDVKKEIS